MCGIVFGQIGIALLASCSEIETTAEYQCQYDCIGNAVDMKIPKSFTCMPVGQVMADVVRYGFRSFVEFLHL